MSSPEKSLKEAEEDIIKRQIEIPKVKSSFLNLYRYASTGDIALVFLSAVCAVIAGATQPLPTV